MKTLAKEQELIYQVFPETFYDGEGKGTGNIKGIIKQLDYLQWLGVNRLWVSPIFTSPFQDSGYDIADYYTINPQFGTMADVEELIAEAKKRNIGIIFDMVFNHTSNQHWWFQKALAGEKKYQDYYIFKDGTNSQPPTNWKSKMGGSVWEYVPVLKKYYLHLFATSQPDLNWKNPEVRAEILAILNFWIVKGVKGFRFDVCNLYDKSEAWINDYQGDGRRFYTDGQKISDYFEFMNRESFGNVENFLTVGEVSSTTVKKSLHYIYPDKTKLDTIFTFLHLKVDYQNNQKWTFQKPDLTQFWEIIKNQQLAYQEKNVFPSLFLNNHDQPRSATRFDPSIHESNEAVFWHETATGWALFMHCLRGISFLYQGEEIGMTNYPFQKLSDFWDVETLGNIADLQQTMPAAEIMRIAKTKARDHARTTMQWNHDFNGGFSTIVTQLATNPNYQWLNVETQKSDSSSVLNWHRQLFQTKKDWAVLSSGQIAFITEKFIFAYKRFLDNEQAYVFFNPTATVQKINSLTTLPDELPSNYEILMNNYPQFDGVNLLPLQAVLLKKKG